MYLSLQQVPACRAPQPALQNAHSTAHAWINRRSELRDSQLLSATFRAGLSSCGSTRHEHRLYWLAAFMVFLSPFKCHESTENSRPRPLPSTHFSFCIRWWSYCLTDALYGLVLSYWERRYTTTNKNRRSLSVPLRIEHAYCNHCYAVQWSQSSKVETVILKVGNKWKQVNA